MSEKVKKKGTEKVEGNTASAESNAGAAQQGSNKTKILFTKQQAKDVQDFKNALEKGEVEIAFVGSSDKLGGAVGQASEHLKGLVHNPHDHNEVHCTGCDGRLDIPEDSKVGEITVCKDCGESYELTKKDGDAFGIKPAEKVAEDWGE